MVETGGYIIYWYINKDNLMKDSKMMKDHLTKRALEIKFEQLRKKEIKEKIKSNVVFIDFFYKAKMKPSDNLIEQLSSKVLVVEEKYLAYHKIKHETKTDRKEQIFRKNIMNALKDILEAEKYDTHLEFHFQMALSHYFNFARFEKNNKKQKNNTFFNQVNFITSNLIFDIFDFYFYEKRLEEKRRMLSGENKDKHKYVKLPANKISEVKREIENYIFDKAHFLILFSGLLKVKTKYQVTPKSFEEGSYFKRSQLYKDAYAHTVHNPSKKLYSLGV